VDEKEKMVYDVVNIPAWNKISLEAILNKHFKVPVFVNNDANCFALGEFLFGKGRDCGSMAGLTIGTGLGCGLIIDQKLFNGRNGGAGEFGMIPYLAHNFEYYASGQYFQMFTGSVVNLFLKGLMPGMIPLYNSTMSLASTWEKQYASSCSLLIVR
jgi:glucokinase